MPTNLHPLFVHFPIALLLSSVALSWAGRLWQGRNFDQAAWYTLWVGVAGTLVTVITGRLAAHVVPAGSPALATLNTHKLMGIATFVIFGLQAIGSYRSKGVYSPGKRILHTVIQLFGVSLIVAWGLFGGELVYTFGVGVTAITP